MRSRVVLSALLAIGAALALGLGATTPAPAQTSSSTTSNIAYSIQLQATIDPATQKWISSSLDDAASSHAAVAIIRLDTPGGLVDSLRSIVQDMEAAPMPVIVYVSPNGARAASAGAYITEAADVAAMAPETNIGSATPIGISPTGSTSDLDQKIVNDAAASMRALASVHGRNPKLAQELVTQATNVTAQQAKKAGLIDVIAPTEEALLQQLDGFKIQGPKAQTLHTAGLEIQHHDLPVTYQLLEVLVNPNISYLLLLAGFIGIAIELFMPGVILPGAFGAICLLLGLYGSAQLPVAPAGVALLILGFGLILLEAHLSTHGILGVAGVVSLAAAGLLLFPTHTSAFEVTPAVVIIVSLILGGGLAFAVHKAVLARRLPKRAGWEEMVGEIAEVRVPIDPEGQVLLNGGLWRAVPAPGARGLDRVSRVRVQAVDGLTLEVAPLDGEDREPVLVQASEREGRT